MHHWFERLSKCLKCAAQTWNLHCGYHAWTLSGGMAAAISPARIASYQTYLQGSWRAAGRLKLSRELRCTRYKRLQM